MKQKEGSPAWTASGSPQSARTTYQASTPRVSAHCITLSDVVVWTAFAIGVGLFLIGLCGLAWVIA